MNKLKKKISEIEKANIVGVGVAFDFDNPFAWLSDCVAIKKSDWVELKKLVEAQ